MATLATLLFEHPLVGDASLLHSVTETITAADARADAEAVATRLRAAGIEPGRAVAVQLPNGPSAITAMFGVWHAGAVFVPVNARSPERERTEALAATRPAAMLTAAGIERLADPARFDADVAFVTWTSGTTGRPKPILHTHAGYLEIVDRVLGPLRGSEPAEGKRRPTPNLIPVSLALNAGIYNVLFGLRAGAEIVVMDGFDPRVFADLVARFSIRSTVLPPAAMTMLADAEDVDDLSPLRYVRSITAPLSPLQARRFTQKFGLVVLNGYGQAELGEVIGWTAVDAREHSDKIGAVGRPHPGVSIRIAPADDAAGERISPAPGAVGRLLVRPPSTAAGIATSRVDAEGYIDTGDLARVDDDGFVWLEGRASDVINRGGNKVFPEQVEEVLRLVPAVTEAAVVGVPDDRLGEVPVAFIAATRAVTDDELVATCREHLAPYKVPVRFRRVDALPRSEVGKVLRRELAAREIS